MSDLIERLRDRSGFVERGPMALMQHCEEAAAELARLTAEVERLRANDARYRAQRATACDGADDLKAAAMEHDQWADGLADTFADTIIAIDAAIKEAGNGS